jgi:hypothetical protein
MRPNARVQVPARAVGRRGGICTFVMGWFYFNLSYKQTLAFKKIQVVIIPLLLRKFMR